MLLKIQKIWDKSQVGNSYAHTYSLHGLIGMLLQIFENYLITAGFRFMRIISYETKY